jgi:hypothetical protein
MATVFIPPMLRRLTRGQQRVDVAAQTLGGVIDRLEARYPGFRDAVIEDGQLRAGLAVAIGSDLATLGLLEPVPGDAEVHFLPAISGG